ncbi:MAG: hypothetical protein F4W90_12525 [Gammaproteobacteria bacterium]|nr:hypothetical protein [Gammaproteobacteria bacterium]
MQRIAFNGDIMHMTNPTTRIVVLTGLVFLLGGCAASSSAPVIAQESGELYACDADDDSWKCQAVDSEQRPTEPSLRPTLNRPVLASRSEPAARQTPQRTQTTQADTQRRPWWQVRVRGANASRTPAVVADAGEPSADSRAASTRPTIRTRPTLRTETPSSSRATPRTTTRATADASSRTERQPRERRGFWNIRLRGRDSATPREETPVLAANTSEPRTTTTQTTRTRSAPAPVRSVAVAAATTAVQPTSTRSSIPTGVASTQTRSQPSNSVSSNPRPQVIAQPQQPTIRRIPRVAQPAAQVAAATPRYGDIPLDGLGRDYDYAVQLGAFTDFGLSSNFMNSFPTLDLTRVKTSARGKTFFVVIAGTFENKRLATAQSEMLASTYGLDDSYIRTVKSIRLAQIN